ncbi:MAG: prolyl oligopeptidase family serine peptidase [Cryomorphaceae bacterium]|nr:prolyl oligopeptidase family serine peptidase [Cryomorphaceae bacterium]
MHKALPSIAVVLVMTIACSPGEDKRTQPMKIAYPETPQVEVADTLYGEIISDPYRWLEDDLSEETALWVKAQNEVTFSYLENIPYRSTLRKRLAELNDYEKISAPFKRGKNTYYFRNDGLQNQSVMYKILDNGKEEVYLDPNTFSEEGTTSLAGLHFTKDGAILAYQISEGGSDWRKIIVIDAETKEQIGDTLTGIKFSNVAWWGNKGFFYSTYERGEGSELSAKTERHRLFYHELGTPQSADKVVFDGPDGESRRYVSASIAENGRYLTMTAANSTSGNELYIKDLSSDKNPFVRIVDNMDNNHSVVHVDIDTLYILTNLDAPNRRLVRVEAKNASPENWEDFISETEMPLNVNSGAGKLFASYLKDATSQIIQYDLRKGKEWEVDLPTVGTAGGFSARWDDEQIYYTFTNYVYPSTIFKYDVNSGESILYRKSDVLFDPEAFESKQIFYTSKDGTRIPMIMTYKRGIELDGSNPTILYGYGGFNISLTPSFNTNIIAWLENGGVYAVANIRGGGEYGRAWHDAGIRTSKQNVFDDFISAAEYLIEEGYTNSERLAISGGSNGGLLVGACMTQRPDLFAVALPAVGVLDMLRYHTFTAGAGWAYDYGTVDDSEEMFRYLLGYSPYHNLKKGQNYPATMVTTADHDDRVVPAHSFKFAAKLQEVNDGPNPTLIRIDVKAGHGAGKPTSMILDEQADKFAFTLWNMGVKSLD